MRSRTGCLTCRERKLKCDENKPTCGQCTKARRECRPSPGIVFRHQQNASLNGEPEGGLERFFGYKKSFGSQSTWVDIPKRLSFVQVTDPYNDDSIDDFSSPEQSQRLGNPNAGSSRPQEQSGSQDPRPAAYALEALSTAATSESYHYPAPDSTPSEDTAVSPRAKADSRGVAASSVQDLSYILNQSPTDVEQSPLEPSHGDLSIGRPQTQNRDSIVRGRTYSTQTLYKDDELVGFLLRHFSEVPGHWMDLFDLGRFFEMEVIVKAARCPVLLYSAIALSSKSLGRLHRSSKRLQEAPFPYSNAQWLHIARMYYDKAIHYLRRALAKTQSPASTYSRPALPGWQVTDSLADDSEEHHTLPSPNDDELVGTTAILCVYEFLDASGEEWGRHLDGAKGLFDITKDGVLAMAPGPSNRRYSNTRLHSANSRVAIFWNMARQDMLDAFINDSASRLDPTDEAMWRMVGLHVADTGYILPSNDPDNYTPMEDDMICNSMVWLAMQVVNFVAAIKKAALRGPDAPGRRTTLQELSVHFSQLTSKVDAWFSGLPDSFRPIFISSASNWAGTTSQCRVRRKWFVRSMCAATMQWYHFARIQLLHCYHYISFGFCIWSDSASCRDGQPPYQSETLEEGKEHAWEIISINLAQTDEGVLVHSVQPLFAAGQMLRVSPTDGEPALVEMKDVRECLLDHMRWIERETGWATEYRVRDLIELWNRPPDRMLNV